MWAIGHIQRAKQCTVKKAPSCIDSRCRGPISFSCSCGSRHPLHKTGQSSPKPAADTTMNSISSILVLLDEHTSVWCLYMCCMKARNFQQTIFNCAVLLLICCEVFLNFIGKFRPVQKMSLSRHTCRIEQGWWDLFWWRSEPLIFFYVFKAEEMFCS